MEQQREQAVSEVSGARTFIEQWRGQLVNQVVWALTGFVLGISMEKTIVHRFPQSYEQGGTIAILVALGIQFAALTIQFFYLRKWNKELRDKHASLLRDLKARVDETFPGDPIRAARIKMQLEEQWPKL